MKARIAIMNQRRQDPFFAYQLPQAVILFKQGKRRLIRDTKDKGILMICDPRLYNRPYGKIFLESLPPMPHTRDLKMVETFFNDIKNSSN
jgi:ATP-dependent DNA helicase DinG